MFRRTVQGCWLPIPLDSFPLTSPPMRHRVPSGSEGPITRGAFLKMNTRSKNKLQHII